MGYNVSQKVSVLNAIGADFGELTNNFGLFLGFSYSLF